MSKFLVERYVIRSEKLEEHGALLQKLRQVLNDNPEKLEMVKSWNAYSQFTGVSGGYIEIWEFANMTDLDNFEQLVASDEELQQIVKEFFAVIVPATRTMEIWSSVL